MNEPPTDEHLRQFQRAVFTTDWGGLIGFVIGLLGLALFIALAIWWPA